MFRLLGVSALCVAWAPIAAAQGLRSQLDKLLTFGAWPAPLQVGVVAPDGRSIVPSNAFSPSAVGANGQLASFLVAWMTADASSPPLASTGGGRTFRFAGGIPVEDRPAPGPIFGESATTLGRGALLAGVNYTGVQFSRVRGVPMNALDLTLTQGPAAGANADAIDLRLSVDYAMSVTALFATWGVLDRVDLGIVVPVVRTRLTGASTARVVSGSGAQPSTVLGGSPEAPLYTSQQSIAGRASGIGDVALRAKVNIIDRPAGGLGVVGDARLPTGDANNLLGSGTFSARLLAVYSGRFGQIVPHAEAGYLYFADRTINDAFLATVGLDGDMARWATVSLSVIGQRHAGSSAYQLPAATNRQPLTNIPDVRDDALSASLGAKVGVGGTRATANVIAPFTRGGPRPDLAYTFGVERVF